MPGTSLNDIFNVFLVVYAGLFPIVDPIGNAPIFLGLTRHSNTADRYVLARLVATNSFFLLVGSLFAGSYVLEFFGVTLPVVRIAGGLVVTAFGWKLLQSGEAEEDAPGDLDQDQRHMKTTDCFYPLTMPLTVGPGAISVAITLGSQRPKIADPAHLAMVGGAAIAGLAAIGATIYVCYRFASRIMAVLGVRGTDVMVRLSAFILVCIGIQILWAGWKALNAAGN
jgi:multiple antibiotic resistance protein